MIVPANLYLLDLREFERELFRMSFPPEGLFPERRITKDFITRRIGNVIWVLPGGLGYSLSDHVTAAMKKPGREVHSLARGTPLPEGVVLSLDKTPGSEGHYMLCPATPMPAAEFVGKLQRIAENPIYCRQLSTAEVNNGK